MTDGELCREILQKIYEDHSRPDGFVFVPFEGTAPDQCARQINMCRQLNQDGLIDWKPNTNFGLARLRPAGRRVVEGTPSLPLVVMNDQSISIIGSHNKIGSHNTQRAKSSVGKIVSATDHSVVSERSSGKGWIASIGAAILSFFGVGSAQ